jgi:hypothetical protein
MEQVYLAVRIAKGHAIVLHKAAHFDHDQVRKNAGDMDRKFLIRKFHSP